MKANEARELSKASAKIEIADLLRDIKELANKGETKLSVNLISGGAMAFLEGEGYKCESIDIGFGRHLFYIKW